jgi:hypothetical protein
MTYAQEQDLGERIAALEATAGKVSLSWQAMAVMLSWLVAFATFASFLARLDERQRETQVILLETASRLDIHVKADGHPVELERLREVRIDVDALKSRRNRP